LAESRAMSERRPIVPTWTFKGAVWTVALLACALFWAAIYRLFLRG
jgi:hypothetical protein